jgi:hypothetical protein
LSAKADIVIHVRFVKIGDGFIHNIARVRVG